MSISTSERVGVARLLSTPTPDLAEHRAHFGPLPCLDVPQLVDLLKRAGLVGRGGAGFPTWRKLADVAAAGARHPVVVANGAEGEPLSDKDAVLLHRSPHLVLDGLALVASALGAREVHVYAGAAAVQSVRAALAERGDRRTQLTEAPDAFVAGEESAVVNRLQGGPALPLDRTLRVTRSGFRGRPTLVQNVETLAHLALLARYGPDWFRAAGRPDEAGTRLLTLSGDLARRGVLEVESGAGIGALLARRGVDLREVRAVLVGGYHGAWVPGAELAHTELSVASLRRFGAAPGAGVVHVLGTRRCGLAASAEIASWLGQQSARQCGPCVNGLPALADVLTRLARRERTPGLVREVHRLSEVVTGRGSCRHPDGTARFVRSALAVFDNDVAAHLQGACEVAA
jgi:NADH:ubiquinone oxidoreductase subunit F (NADH-binding)